MQCRMGSELNRSVECCLTLTVGDCRGRTHQQMWPRLALIGCTPATSPGNRREPGTYLGLTITVVAVILFYATGGGGGAPRAAGRPEPGGTWAAHTPRPPPPARSGGGAGG